FLLIIILACTNCHTDSLIKIGMNEKDVIDIIESNGCEETPQQTVRFIIENGIGIPITDHYYQLPNGKYMYFAFEGEALILTEITYLGEYQEGLSPKFAGCFDPAKYIQYKEVNIASLTK
ncbi:MAG: hypothetical protein K8S87_11270, partial [Planctomycetes bacterium]|nr:hypothetical protein [Planctomycetota bacterium]